MDINFALQEYGLTEKETNTYLTLLPLGAVSLQQLAKKLPYPRTTTYNTLTYLAQKGLVAKITKKRVNFFEATDPQKFVDKLEQRKRLINSVLPELEGMKALIRENSTAEIYEGSQGLFTVLSDVFAKKQQTYYFGSYSLSMQMLKHQPAHFRTLRMERKIPAKIVIDPYDEPLFRTKEYKKITEMRFLSGLKEFPCMIFIYGEKVAMYTLKGELIGIIIKSKEVALAMRMVFDAYWKSAKPSA